MRNLVLVLLFFMTSCGFRSIPMAKNEVESKWAQVINQYKRRADLIPNLVETVKGYAAQEKDTLTAVVEARAKATSTNISVDQLNAQTMQKFQQAQGGLSSALSRLMVVVEKYPELKSNENFLSLQSQIEGTENRISVARRDYIEAVKFFNNQVTVPPESIMNSLFYKFNKMPQFTVENLEEVKEAPKVKF